MTEEQITRKIKSIIASLDAATRDLNDVEVSEFDSEEDRVRCALRHAEAGVNEIKRLISDGVGGHWG